MHCEEKSQLRANWARIEPTYQGSVRFQWYQLNHRGNGSLQGKSLYVSHVSQYLMYVHVHTLWSPLRESGYEVGRSSWSLAQTQPEWTWTKRQTGKQTNKQTYLLLFGLPPDKQSVSIKTIKRNKIITNINRSTHSKLSSCAYTHKQTKKYTNQQTWCKKRKQADIIKKKQANIQTWRKQRNPKTDIISSPATQGWRYRGGQGDLLYVLPAGVDHLESMYWVRV